ncbi:enoyl-CoA hydratase [Longibacter salinarum]|uniref:Enoyl-CoA hydratase n=1 Tax=Longibacter salinarum TaxID=1850348 RepID=A0A2A8CVQ9_9BACT|nr:enoyl-CoA hydratase-related protein [Longibacter salinarum]PEN12839.1 enoyl-CoA hydratase [Longibacter salinarum]
MSDTPTPDALSADAPTYETVLFERDGAVVTLTMNRPERRNALHPSLDRDLRDAFDHVSEDDSIRAVVLTGAGNGFCAGADLSVLKDSPTPEDLYDHLTTRYLPLIEGIQSCPKPIIAGVNGMAAGAGMALALACDLIVMADDAAMIMAFSQIGFVPDSGASYFLVRQVGYNRAFELAAEAQPIGAEQCHDLGIANKVVPSSTLLEATADWAQHLAERPTTALALTKEALQFAQDHDLKETIEFESELQMNAIQTRDHREGLSAFLEKREPEFRGD